MSKYREDEIQELKEEIIRVNEKYCLNMDEESINSLVWCCVEDIEMR